MSKEVVEELALVLIEALPYVSTSPSEGLVNKARPLIIKAQEEPGILSPTC